MTILEEIFENKQIEVEASKRSLPMEELRSECENNPPPPDFIRHLRESTNSPALIAEVKFASPSKGKLVADPAPLGLAQTYIENGASALSVLTDLRYFHGSLDYLRSIHSAFPSIPILRKDFIFDQYQIYEARLAGASAVLLIASYLDPIQMADLNSLANSLNMVALLEVHSREELNRAMRIDQLLLLGINNRDLKTFKVDINISVELRPLIDPEIYVIAESGIQTRQDVLRLREAKMDAMLVGEALVTSKDIPGKIQSLIGGDSAA